MSASQMIGHYQIQELLGSGGMGAVYRAVDTQLRRYVALKVLLNRIANVPAFREQFVNEARAIAVLSHPNIVQIFAFHSEDNDLYLVMEYVFGRSLRDLLRTLRSQSRYLDLDDALELSAQVAVALDYAHQNRIVHRDVKPSNILLKFNVDVQSEEGKEKRRTGEARFRAVLTDFGLATLVKQFGGTLADFSMPIPFDKTTAATGSADMKRTLIGAPPETQVFHTQMDSLDDAMLQTNVPLKGETQARVSAIGTLAYRSPEQAWGEKVDKRTDIYSLGIVLYEMIAGETPFQPQTDEEAARMHGSQPPPRLTGRRAGVSIEIENIVLKALNKLPQERFQSGREFAEALREALQRRKGIHAGGRETVIEPIPMAETEAEIEGIADYLDTILEKELPLPEYFPPPEIDESVDQLLVKQGAQIIKAVPFIEPILMVGRDPEHLISLSGEKVSRNHASIEREEDGSFTIIDLGSTNGTYMDGVKLLSNVIEPWKPGQVVTIGDFELHIQKAVAREGLQKRTLGGVDFFQTIGGVNISEMSEEAEEEKTPSRLEAEKPKGPSVEVEMRPPFLTVDPGSRAEMQVDIANQGDLVEHYRIAVQGIPNEWVTVPLRGIQLLPGARGTVSIAFHPDKDSASSAGTYPLSLRIASEERGAEIARENGLLTVTPFYKFTSESDPKTIRGQGLVQVIITNQSNAPDSYTISGKDPTENVRFVPPSTSTSIGAGLSKIVEVEVRPRRSRLIGGKKPFKYDIEVLSASSETKTESGELIARGVLPIWLLGLMLLLCLACIGLFALSQRGTSAERITDNAATATSQDLRDLLTSTAVQFATLTVQKGATATSAFEATATTVAGEDPDGDGLTNAEEIVLEIDPQKPDTDSDGLLDGQEIELGTDPNKNDTDGDTLLDGDEVRIFVTNPLEKDTDGDGAFDNIEIQQLQTNPNQFDTDNDGIADGSDSSPLDPALPVPFAPVQ